MNDKPHPIIISVGSATDNKVHDVQAEDFLSGIRSGRWAYAIEPIRERFNQVLAETGDIGAAKESVTDAKKTLPGALFSGTFSKRGKAGLVKHSGLLVADVDGLSDVEAEELRHRLTEDDRVMGSFVSPTARGVKVLFRIAPDAEKHSAYYDAAAAYLRTQYGVAADPSCRDYSRLCFASLDRNATWSWDAPELQLPVNGNGAPKAQATQDDLPREGIDQNDPPLSTATTQIDWAQKYIDAIPGEAQGGRNAAGNRIAYGLLEKFPGLTDGDLLGLLGGWNARCTPPLGENELTAVVRSAATGAQRNGAVGGKARVYPNTRGWSARSEYGLDGDGDEQTAEVKPFTIWSPRQFLEYVEPEGSHLLLPRYLTLEATTSILGPPGVGKSRLTVWLAICQITGRDWCGLKTGGEAQTWLLLGDENSIGRFQFDLIRMLSVLDDREQELVERHLRLQAVCDPEDGDLDCGESRVAARIVKTIQQVTPGAVVLDPLASFHSGDLSKPGDMREAVRAVTKTITAGARHASRLLSHHARTGSASTLTAIGWDAGSYGLGGKSLLARSRCAINLASGDEQGDSVVVACGKANDCEKFTPRCVELNPETMTYTVDADWDIESWRAAVEGKRSAAGDATCTLKTVVDCVREGMTKTKEIVTHLGDAVCAKERTVKRLLSRATDGGFLCQVTRGHYVLGPKHNKLETKD